MEDTEQDDKNSKREEEDGGIGRRMGLVRWKEKDERHERERQVMSRMQMGGVKVGPTSTSKRIEVRFPDPIFQKEVGEPD